MQKLKYTGLQNCEKPEAMYMYLNFKNSSNGKIISLDRLSPLTLLRRSVRVSLPRDIWCRCTAAPSRRSSRTWPTGTVAPTGWDSPKQVRAVILRGKCRRREAASWELNEHIRDRGLLKGPGSSVVDPAFPKRERRQPERRRTNLLFAKFCQKLHKMKEFGLKDWVRYCSLLVDPAERSDHTLNILRCLPAQIILPAHFTIVICGKLFLLNFRMSGKYQIINIFLANWWCIIICFK